MSTPLVGVLLATGFLGLLGVLWALFRDRSRGRQRCPRCWYDMDGVPELRCPECGHEVRSVGALYRTRRRWRLALVMSVVAAGSLGTIAGTTVSRAAVVRNAPSTLLILVWPNVAGESGMAPRLRGSPALPAVTGWNVGGTDTLGTLVAVELATRANQGGMWRWQRRMLVRRCGRVWRDHPAEAPRMWSRRMIIDCFASADEALPDLIACSQTEGPGSASAELLLTIVQVPGGSIYDCTEELLRLTQEDEYWQEGVIILAMARRGVDLEVLLPLLEWRLPRRLQRTSYYWSLGFYPQHHDVLEPKLVAAFERAQDTATRKNIAMSLARLGAGETVVEVLIDRLRPDSDTPNLDETPYLEMAWVLPFFGSRAHAAAEPLRSALLDPRLAPDTAIAIRAALRQITGEHDEVLDELIAFAMTEQYFVRGWNRLLDHRATPMRVLEGVAAAMEVHSGHHLSVNEVEFWNTDFAPEMDRILEWLALEDPVRFGFACAAVRQMAPRGQEAAPALRKRLYDNDLLIRETAAITLRHLREKPAAVGRQSSR